MRRCRAASIAGSGSTTGARPAQRPRCASGAPGPMFGLGLRAMITALTFLPIADRRFGKPFYALDREARMRCIEALAEHDRYAVRQMVSTLKIMACFAYYEDERVRTRSR